MTEPDHLEQLVTETRAFVEMRPVPDLTTAVMGRIDDLRVGHAVRPSRSRTFSRLWTPTRISFAFRPAYALATAAVIVAVAVWIPHQWRASVERAIAERSSANQTVLVQFRLQAPDATDVRLAGSFSGWRPQYELHQAAPGLWTITVPLSPGVHDYAFIVDGRQWVTDPFATSVQDGFGGTNSRITLVVGDRRL